MPDPTITIVCFVVGICASFVGSQVGGGGAITIPALIMLGLPSHSAIAVHRLATIFGVAPSIRNYSKAKKVLWKYTVPFMILYLVGGVIGAKIMLEINEQVLSRAIGFVILIPLFFLFFGDFGIKNKKTSKKLRIVGYIITFLISVWSGVFPAGGLTLTLYVLVFFFGMTFMEGKATMIVPKILARLVVVGIFIYEGIVVWSYGIPLGIGYVIGSHLGSKTAIEKGDKWVRALLAFVVSALATKLIFF
ncbi:sulfite exporter TauE/SafE family protein [Patescibacteria group bacterium]|nr:sulfite exporter TauE/SafE family protein [Patescibacteria group bacterium]MBU1123266.1 sulfite exporter TauE/SafE family protein [Patescibacteria group bacterium]MBU1911110.1 sulfite exporter TauE/SafE family protein [Patescibacteria group bacterium]